jgi:ribonuclease III
VLGLVVAEHCYRVYPDMPEGALAKVRAATVNTAVLAEVAWGLDLGAALLLGRGEDVSGGRSKASILANAVEAVIGAVYLDGGWEVASTVVLPRYEVEGTGPDHARRYRARVLVADVERGVGEGRSKKDAEQAAARVAWALLVEGDDSDDDAAGLLGVERLLGAERKVRGSA